MNRAYSISTEHTDYRFEKKMKKFLSNLLDFLFAWCIMLPGFWVCVYLDRAHNSLKEKFYIFRKIPYYRQRGNFHSAVFRLDKQSCWSNNNLF